MEIGNKCFWKIEYLIKWIILLKIVIVILKLLFELNIYELDLKGSWIRINDNWIWYLIENEVNWDVNVVIID